MSEAFVEKLQNLLLERNITSVIELVNHPENAPKIQENPWETIPAITAHLNESVKKQDPRFFETCRDILATVAGKLQPDDVLLIIIKDVESASDDLMFATLLKPLQRAVLELLPKKRLNYFAWCFNSIQTYVNELPLPENLNLEGAEKLLMDTDGNVARISALYSELLPFYDPIIQEIIELNSHRELKTLAAKFLLQLLGKPLAFLDVGCENKPRSKARRIAEDLTSKITGLCCDVYRFLNADFNKETDDDIRVKDLAFGTFFYLVLSERVCLEKCPKVYEPVYVFQNCLKYAVELFNHENQFVTEKAIRLSTALLSMVSGNKLSHHLLDSDVHCKFCKGLTRVMIYSPVEAYRKSTLEIFRTYLYQFDTRGRYLVIYNVTSTFNYAAITSYLVTQYKEMMVEELNDENVSEYFRGGKLLELLDVFCKLPEGAESDLMKLADQIIASINLLRYLALRDKRNVTEIWGHFGSLEKNYLEPLLKALALSKAHYNLKVKEVLTENAHGDKGGNDSKVSVTIGGHNLPELSTTEKLHVLNSSITAFDVMESLLCRLNECIQSGSKSEMK